MSAVNLFVSMWRTWRVSVPDSLADEDPGLILDLLEHAGSPTGTSQRELLAKLGIGQTRLSKLMVKLRAERWIEDIHSGGGDGRVRRVLETSKARAAIDEAGKALRKLKASPAPKARESWRGTGPRTLFSPPQDVDG